MSNELLNKELKLKDEEIKGLKRKNLFDNIFTSFKILSFVSITIFFMSIFYTKAVEQGLINGFETPSKVQVGTLTIDKQITSDYISKLITKLETIKYDETIKEIIVIMNSPGGSPSASDEFSEYLKDFTKYKKVTMYVEGIAASGGYYIASSIKPLYVNKNAVIGSIGVILQKFTIAELAKKVGVKEDNIVQGDYKAPISFFKDVDEEGKKYLKSNIMAPMYNNFLEIVAKNRNVELDIIKKYAEGKIFLATYPDIKDILFDEITNFISIKNQINTKLSNEYKIEIKEIKYKNLNEINENNKLFNISLKLNSDFLTETSFFK